MQLGKKLKNIYSSIFLIFSPFRFVLLSQELGIADRLRDILSKHVWQRKDLFPVEILGKETREEYSAWILNDQVWGGATELAIFSDYFQMEIVSIDIQTLRLDHFGNIKNNMNT